MFTDSKVVDEIVEVVVVVVVAVIVVLTSIALEPSTPEKILRLLTAYLFLGLYTVNI